ncbi:MAG: hypothetical protein SCM11_19825 [Bacillota bacterium]|nr:hypothetical protein [Bacillota bacterium]
MVKRLIPHLCIILSLLMLTFVILDNYNPGMDFVGNSFFKLLLVVFCLAALAAAGLLIAYDRKSR